MKIQEFWVDENEWWELKDIIILHVSLETII